MSSRGKSDYKTREIAARLELVELCFDKLNVFASRDKNERPIGVAPVETTLIATERASK